MTGVKQYVGWIQNEERHAMLRFASPVALLFVYAAVQFAFPLLAAWAAG